MVYRNFLEVATFFYEISWKPRKPRKSFFLAPSSKGVSPMNFVLENPATSCLNAQRYMLPLAHFRKVCDFCQYKTFLYGEWVQYPFRKPTALWTNIDFEGRRCKCPGRRHASSLVGDKARGRRKDRGGGKAPPLAFKHAIPTELHLQILSKVRGDGFVLDLFCGTQSLKIACDILGLKYIGVDIKKWARRPDGEKVSTDIVQDLSGCDLREVIRRASKLARCKLLLVWISVPCVTFSQAQTISPPGRRHRDYSHPARPPISQTAKDHDALVANIATQLLAKKKRRSFKK